MEFEEPYEQKMESWSARGVFSMFACVIAAKALQEFGGLSYISGFCLAFAAFMVIDYRIPPRPPESFSVWAIKVLAHIAPMWLVLSVLSPLLSRWIGAFLAYAVPIFILMLSFYWLPPLYPVKKPDSFKKRLLLSLGVAVAFGLIAHFGPPDGW